MKNCVICKKIRAIKSAPDPLFVAELPSGYIYLDEYQFYRGYTLLLCKKCVNELHELPPSFKQQFLKDMSLVAEAIFKAFKPRKLNYELLGNSAPHLHWHIFPRYKKDILPKIPVWNNPSFLMNKTHPSKSELDQLRKKLLREIDKILKRERL